MLALVAVEAAVFAIDKPYSYLVPEDLSVVPGMRVVVPFGRSNRRSEAVVLSLSEGSGEKLKYVESVLDSEPLLDDNMLKLAAFLRERYFCTFYDAVKVILPAGVFVKAEVVYTRTSLSAEPECRKEQEILRLIEELGGNAGDTLLKKTFGDDCTVQLEHLVQRGFLKTNRLLQSKSADKTETVLDLAVLPEEAAAYAASQRRRAPMQAAVLELLAVTGCVSRKEVCYFRKQLCIRNTAVFPF